MRDRKIEKASPVSEILRVGVGIAQIVVDQHGGLSGKLKPFAAFETRHQIIEPHHVGRGFSEFSSIFFAGAARQFPLLPRHFPAYGKFEFAAAARADELDLSGFFSFGVKRAFVHG